MQYWTALLILATALLCYLGFFALAGAGGEVAKLLFVISLILLAINLARTLLGNHDRSSHTQPRKEIQTDRRGGDRDD